LNNENREKTGKNSFEVKNLSLAVGASLQLWTLWTLWVLWTLCPGKLKHYSIAWRSWRSWRLVPLFGSSLLNRQDAKLVSLSSQ
jgi:hypothetical protein